MPTMTRARADNGQVSRRRLLIATAGLGLSGIAWALPSSCERRSSGTTANRRPAAPPRVGVLALGAPAAGSPNVGAVRDGLRGLGYVEGQTIVLDVRYSSGEAAELRARAAELIELGVAVIVALGDQPSKAARALTETIPIVMAPSGDPVAAGLVAGYARPGGNVTGLSMIAPDLAAKRLELLSRVIPGLSHVAVLWDAADPTKVAEFREATVAASAGGIELVSLPVTAPHELGAAVADGTHKGAQALLVFANPLTIVRRAEIVALAAEQRLPTLYALRDFVAAGGLMSYGADLLAVQRRAALYVDKLLKGARAADLPVERPTTFDLVVNLATARTLGLTIPDSVLAQATEVMR
jgi:putative ABC transport system substrate-binding protein